MAARGNKNSPPSAVLTAARKSTKKAYAPYSRYQVGAAVKTASGKIFSGSNIENISYGATVCAERVAVWKAVSEGHRRFSWLAISTQGGEKPYPCGTCRQVLQEFAENLNLIIDHKGKTEIISLAALFPKPFTK